MGRLRCWLRGHRWAVYVWFEGTQAKVCGRCGVQVDQPMTINTACGMQYQTSSSDVIVDVVGSPWKRTRPSHLKAVKEPGSDS